MHRGFHRLFCLIALLGATAFSLRAQTAAPTTGEVTVRLVSGLDSATNPVGATSGALVTRSTNTSIPRNTAAQVQLVALPDGTFGVQLTHLMLQGTSVPVSSASSVLAPDLAEQVRIHTRQPNAPKDSVSGPRVFLPTQSVVRFVLTAAAASPAGPPPGTARASQPEPPLVWQPVKTFYKPEDPGNTGVAINVLATSGTRRGHARLAVNCTDKSNLAVHLLINPALSSYKVDDYNSVSGPGQTDDDALGSLNFDGKTTAVFLTGNSGDDNPVHLTLSGGRNGLPDSFFSESNASKPFALTLKAPDGKGTPTVIAFTTPADPAALVAVASPCLHAQAQQEAERKAKIVASCPEQPGKHIFDATPKRVPAGKAFDVDSDEDGGSTYYIKLRPGQRAILVCRYLPDGISDPPKVFPPADRISIPLPANTATCQSGAAGTPEYDCSRS